MDKNKKSNPEKEKLKRETEELYRNHGRNWWSRTQWLLAVAMEIEHQLLSFLIFSKPKP